MRLSRDAHALHHSFAPSLTKDYFKDYFLVFALMILLLLSSGQAYAEWAGALEDKVVKWLDTERLSFLCCLVPNGLASRTAQHVPPGQTAPIMCPHRLGAAMPYLESWMVIGTPIVLS